MEQLKFDSVGNSQWALNVHKSNLKALHNAKYGMVWYGHAGRDHSARETTNMLTAISDFCEQNNLLHCTALYCTLASSDSLGLQATQDPPDARRGEESEVEEFCRF